MRTRRSAKNQDRLYNAISRALQVASGTSTLIAAAPDLLTACKLAHAQLSNLHKMNYPCCDGDGCLTNAIIVKLATAIAKAEGDAT